ncbi:universal stress protein [Rhodocytophaga rosea]|uniref:Universal stress protein n=1 Tax=Rhodocytophaga rosea TaxID=2704465 RepID=A0A6C0GVE1_9BACT|nr:universal stress protein [Rhodocytophaga rosea]QHT71310.1 universal stress protein [Rhodocytophaga rosea]
MKTIVCPTDFSACANNAVVYANQLANKTQARLVLVHSTFVPDAMPYAGISVHAATSTYGEEMMYQDRLVNLCQELKKQNPNSLVAYATKVGYRPVTDEIAHVANTENADLIVMGTTGAHGLKEIVLGSNTADVIEISRRPLLVVPEQASFAPIKHIIFAADLTREHPANIALTVELATLFGAHISFLHVLREDNFMTGTTAKIEYSHRFSGIGYDKVSFHTQEDENIERGILTFGKTHKADLIVMVNHQQSFWRSVFSNSHTKEMAYHTTIPLLAIHD